MKVESMVQSSYQLLSSQQNRNRQAFNKIAKGLSYHQRQLGNQISTRQNWGADLDTLKDDKTIRLKGDSLERYKKQNKNHSVKSQRKAINLNLQRTLISKNQSSSFVQQRKPLHNNTSELFPSVELNQMHVRQSQKTIEQQEVKLIASNNYQTEPKTQKNSLEQIETSSFLNRIPVKKNTKLVQLTRDHSPMIAVRSTAFISSEDNEYATAPGSQHASSNLQLSHNRKNSVNMHFINRLKNKRQSEGGMPKSHNASSLQQLNQSTDNKMLSSVPTTSVFNSNMDSQVQSSLPTIKLNQALFSSQKDAKEILQSNFIAGLNTKSNLKSRSKNPTQVHSSRSPHEVDYNRFKYKSAFAKSKKDTGRKFTQTGYGNIQSSSSNANPISQRDFQNDTLMTLSKQQQSTISTNKPNVMNSYESAVIHFNNKISSVNLSTARLPQKSHKPSMNTISPPKVFSQMQTDINEDTYSTNSKMIEDQALVLSKGDNQFDKQQLQSVLKIATNKRSRVNQCQSEQRRYFEEKQQSRKKAKDLRALFNESMYPEWIKEKKEVTKYTELLKSEFLCQPLPQKQADNLVVNSLLALTLAKMNINLDEVVKENRRNQLKLEKASNLNELGFQNKTKFDVEMHLYNASRPLRQFCNQVKTELFEEPEENKKSSKVSFFQSKSPRKTMVEKKPAYELIKVKELDQQSDDPEPEIQKESLPSSKAKSTIQTQNTFTETSSSSESDKDIKIVINTGVSRQETGTVSKKKRGSILKTKNDKSYNLSVKFGSKDPSPNNSGNNVTTPSKKSTLKKSLKSNVSVISFKSAKSISPPPQPRKTLSKFKKQGNSGVRQASQESFPSPVKSTSPSPSGSKYRRTIPREHSPPARLNDPYIYKLLPPEPNLQSEAMVNHYQIKKKELEEKSKLKGSDQVKEVKRVVEEITGEDSTLAGLIMVEDSKVAENEKSERKRNLELMGVQRYLEQLDQEVKSAEVLSAKQMAHFGSVDEDRAQRVDRLVQAFVQGRVDDRILGSSSLQKDSTRSKLGRKKSIMGRRQENINQSNQLFNEIVGKMDLNKVIKNPYAVQKDEKLVNHTNFYKECLLNMDHGLPLLKKIRNKHLKLSNYTLSNAQCRALRQVCSIETDSSDNKQDLFRFLELDNCGLLDADFASILKGCNNMRDIKQITYAKGELGEKSVEAMVPLFKRFAPFQLTHLELNSCKGMSFNVVDKLFTALKQESYLTSLSLNQLQLGELAIKTIAQFIQSSKYLKEIDLSGLQGDLRPSNFLPLLEVLAENRTLKKLNLHFNTLLDKQPKYDPSAPSPKHLPQGVSPDLCLTPLGEKVFDCISRLIKKSKQLEHLDLSHCSLSEAFLVRLCNSIKKSVSLQGIHLSGNQGVTLRTKLTFKAVLDALPSQIPVTISSDIGGDALSRSSFDFRDKKPVRTSAPKDSSMMKEITQMYHKNADKAANFYSIVNHQKLVLHRCLGHETDIAESSKWNLMLHKEQPDGCWVCEKWTYAIIFFNERSTKIHRSQEQKLELAKIVSQLDQLVENNDKMFESCDSLIGQVKMPTVYGTFTNWKPKSMVKFKDLWEEICSSLPKDKPIMEELKDKGVLRPKQTTFNDLSNKQVEMYKDIEYERKMKWQRSAMDDFKRCLRYSKPNLINIEQVSYYNLDTTYCLPVLLRPGKQHFVIRDPCFTNQPNPLHSRDISSQGSQLPVQVSSFRQKIDMNASGGSKEGFLRDRSRMHVDTFAVDSSVTSSFNRFQPYLAQYYSYKVVAPLRYEEIPTTSKTSTIARHMPFQLSLSLFAQWTQYDQNEVDLKVQNNDSRYWKIKQIMTKNRVIQKLPSFLTPAQKELYEQNFSQPTIDSVRSSANLSDNLDAPADRTPRVSDASRTSDFLKDMVGKISVLYIHLASQSFFPFIRRSDLISWCSQSGIRDDYVTENSLNTIYNQCFTYVYELMHKTDTQQQGLQRASFVEFLVRLSKHKYIDQPAVGKSLFVIQNPDGSPGKARKTIISADSLRQAVQFLFEDFIEGQVEQIEWMDFRRKEIWRFDVNTMFQKHWKNLQEVFAFYQKPNKKYIKLDKAIKLVLEDAKIVLTKQQVTYAFGMSKAPIVNGHFDDARKYKKIEFFEFLEFIGRLADIQFKDTELQSLPLVKKMEPILEKLLGVVRKDTEPDDQIEEESEEDEP